MIPRSAARCLKVCTYGTLRMVQSRDTMISSRQVRDAQRKISCIYTRVANTRDYWILIMAESIKF